MWVWQVLSRRGRTQFGDLAALKTMPPSSRNIDGVLMLAGGKEGRGQQQHERDLSRISARYRFPGMRHVP